MPKTRIALRCGAELETLAGDFLPFVLRLALAINRRYLASPLKPDFRSYLRLTDLSGQDRRKLLDPIPRP
jgi:hypothetical protein